MVMKARVVESDIDFIKEIMSSKEKFLENVSSVEFGFKYYLNNDMNPKDLVVFTTYSAHNSAELKDFYDNYELKYWGDMEIKCVEEVSSVSSLRKKYWVEMYKKSDADSDIPFDCIFYAEMLLCMKENGDEYQEDME
mgnify:CR=1 FL=1